MTILHRSPERRKRPQRELEGKTVKAPTAHGTLYVTVNWDNSDGLPFEVFATLGKAGSCDSANLEGLTRLISLALQFNIPVAEIIHQLENISCHPYLLTNQEVGNTSPIDAISKVLKDSYEGPDVEDTKDNGSE